ncbi:MAG TPA: hypothetical protein VNT55_05220 [Baekduia sp.]|nr:hypothetical protein [Baekduia sp.]
MTLLEREDLKAFKIAARGDHGLVDGATLVALAGERGTDLAWLEQLDGMLAYAASKG